MRTWTTKELAMMNKKSVSTIRSWVRKGKISHMPGQPDRFGMEALIKLGLMNHSDARIGFVESSLKKLKANR